MDVELWGSSWGDGGVQNNPWRDWNLAWSQDWPSSC